MTAALTLGVTARHRTTGTPSSGGGGAGLVGTLEAESLNLTGSGNTTVTSASFTPAVGELLVVKATSSSSNAMPNAISGGGLVWTQRASVGTPGASSPAVIWTAAVATSAAMTISVVFNNAVTVVHHGAFVLERFTGAALAATPVAVTADADATSPYQTTLTTSANNSLVSWIATDYQGVNGTVTYVGAPTQTYRYQEATAGILSFSTGYQTATTAGVQTFGLSAPAGQTVTLAGIELVAGTPSTSGGSTSLLTLGAQGWRDQTAAQQVGSGNLGAAVMRVEFTIGELAVATTVADYCNTYNIRLQPLIGWDNGTAAPDLTGLADWAAALGPGGTHWGGASPVAAVTDIELGNENSMFYKSGLPGSAGYQNLATTYGNRARDAAVAINNVNPSVGVLVELEGGDSNNSTWVDRVLTAGGTTLKNLMRGPTIHLYGPGWQTKLDLNRGFLAANGVTKPYYVTETGISTDNGRALSDNFGWPTNLTYSQAATDHQTVIEGLASQPAKVAMVSVFNDHDNADPGASTDREDYFGVTTAPFGNKGAVTTYFRQAFATYRGGVTGGGAGGGGTTPPTSNVVALDSSTPAVVRRAYAVGTTVTSASFTPPTGALQVALVNVGYGPTPAAQPALSVTDTAGGTWTQMGVLFNGAWQSAIFTSPVGTSTARQVAATSSSTLGKSMQLAVRVLTGAAAPVFGAGVWTSTTSMTAPVTTTAAGSLVLVAATSGDNLPAITADSTTTSIDVWSDVNSGEDMAVGQSSTTTATPGTAGYGWAPATNCLAVALEIVPGTITTGGGGTSAPLLSSLSDNFNTGTLSALWTPAGGGVVGNQLYVNVNQTGGTPVYSNVRSAQGYQWSGSSLTFQVNQMPGVASTDTANAQFWVMDPNPAATVDRFGFEYVALANRLDLIGQSGATYAAVGATTQLTYSATTHRWMRIAHTGTSIVWSTSPDNVTWTVRRTLTTPPSWTTKTTLIVSFEGFRTTGTNDTVLIDNVN